MSQSNVSQLKVLVVEDEPIIMMMTRKMLEELGCQPDCAVNGAEALALVRAHHYNVIFMDIGLPDMDGITVTKQTRQCESARGGPFSHIFVLTAYLLAEVREKCFKVGVNDVFSKPATVDMFKNLLASV